MPLPPQCVIDTNIIFDFWCCGLLELLLGIGTTLVTTDLVAAELCDPPRPLVTSLGLTVASLSGAQLLEIQTLEERVPQTSMVDRSALVLARDHGLTLLTGDSALRMCAEELGIEVHGTLYILDEMVGTGLIDP